MWLIGILLLINTFKQIVIRSTTLHADMNNTYRHTNLQTYACVNTHICKKNRQLVELRNILKAITDGGKPKPTPFVESISASIHEPHTYMMHTKHVSIRVYSSMYAFMHTFLCVCLCIVYIIFLIHTVACRKESTVFTSFVTSAMIDM